MQYDIIHIEDNQNERMFVEEAARRHGLTYSGVPSLQALEGALTVSSAKVYLVDGRFPVAGGQAVEQNAHRAFASIRKTHPDARIVLFSSGWDAEGIAREHSVDYRSKEDYTSGKLVEELKVML
ncbi:MAG: response regulator [Candidatus Aenigmarchaeota archaeon]|nr:response regulator [Candidatus Aenigmarchaeota archaeon]